MVKIDRIYTKKGDKGQTSLLGSKKRIEKSSKIISTIGSIDEANSFLGIIEAQTQSRKLKGKIRRIQNNLFRVDPFYQKVRNLLNAEGKENADPASVAFEAASLSDIKGLFRGHPDIPLER